MDAELNNKIIKEIIKEKYWFFVPKKIIYSFRIDKKLLDRAKKEAKKLGLCTSAFIRQAIIDKLSYNIISYYKGQPRGNRTYTSTKIKLQPASIIKTKHMLPKVASLL